MIEIEDELIAKKDLLARYGISYGALYRWKRKGLIPEEWFIRKSTVTGQETFFNREQICGRIDEILRLKDESSLDELASRYSEKEEGSGITFIVETGFAKRSFRADEISSLRVIYPDGSEKELSERLLTFLKCENQNNEKGGT